MSDDEILDFQTRVANSIVAKLNCARVTSPVTDAIELLLHRLVDGGNSLRLLRDKAQHRFEFDGALILRGNYDTMLQALYILQSPATRDARAQLYLDFFWVEKVNSIALFDRSPTGLGKHVAQSPRRAAVEPAIQAEFQRVQGQFTNSKGRLRAHWYEGQLDTLAKALGLEAEYTIMQRQL
jgi:hypothetical protein